MNIKVLFHIIGKRAIIVRKVVLLTFAMSCIYLFHLCGFHQKGLNHVDTRTTSMVKKFPVAAESAWNCFGNS